MIRHVPEDSSGHMFGKPTYEDLVAVAKKLMCCIELRDAMTL